MLRFATRGMIHKECQSPVDRITDINHQRAMDGGHASCVWKQGTGIFRRGNKCRQAVIAYIAQYPRGDVSPEGPLGTLRTLFFLRAGRQTVKESPPLEKAIA